LINALDVLLRNGTYFGPAVDKQNSSQKDDTNRGISFLRALDFLNVRLL
jgi:hypothetical protein